MVDIVSGFHGTLIEPTTVEEENRKIVYAIKDSVWVDIKRGKVWKAGKFASLLRDKRQLEKRLSEYEAGKRSLSEVYEYFNRILKGHDPAFIQAQLREYAVDLIKEGKIDRRLVRAIAEAKRGGSRTGILSVATNYLIQEIFGQLRSRHGTYKDLFSEDQIVANSIKTEDGKVVGFTLDIYGNKARIFEDEFLRRRGYSDKNTVYFGDNMDDTPVAELLPKRHFIPSFYATDEFKQHVARYYGSEVPETERQLRRFLISL